MLIHWTYFTKSDIINSKSGRDSFATGSIVKYRTIKQENTGMWRMSEKDIPVPSYPEWDRKIAVCALNITRLSKTCMIVAPHDRCLTLIMGAMEKQKGLIL